MDILSRFRTTENGTNCIFISRSRSLQKDKKGKATFFALPVSPFESEENVLKMSSKNWKAMRSFATKTRKHLNKSDGTERKISLEELNLEHLRTTVPDKEVVKNKELQKQTE